MKKQLGLLLALLLASSTTFSQHEVYVNFLFRNLGQPFALDQTITAYNGVNYKVQDMAFFISRVEITHDGGQVTALDTNEVFYVNHNAPYVFLGNLDISTVEAITFDAGVPEYLNHLDISQYPEGHPLGFHSPSMHWGWIAGYMHMVMNGWGDSDGNGDPDITYQLNCLGDDNVHTVTIPTTSTVIPDDKREIILYCNVDQWLRNSDPATTGAAHGSNGINATVMMNVTHFDVFESPATAGISEPEMAEVQIAQNGTEVQLSWSDAPVKAFRLYDADGRLLRNGNCSEAQLSLTELNAGLHMIQLFSDKDVLIGTAKWIVP